ncbi:disease resistance protein RPV1-like [Rosa chinensis]|uniref:disease resistance protein RPV1-like n=1 Tax=Rosa chinensis TaxID=74649 RepID=UPI001AD8FA3E|nr:disease resistance protein RPV1-like [Rosa chinensis]
MSLISVGEYSTLEMHDLIQEMGREIVRDQCVKNPEKRSRLWLANDVRRVLENNTGTEDIECMAMNMDLIKDLYVNVASFEKMHKLRLLDLYSYSYTRGVSNLDLPPMRKLKLLDLYWYTRGVNKLHLPTGFEFLPEALKYLRWHFLWGWLKV